MAFLTDTFTDVDAKLLTAHTGELGATWTDQPGGGASGGNIQANRWYPASSLRILYASGVPGSADYDVEGVIFCVTETAVNAHVGVCGRMDTAADTGYSALYVQGAGWQLYRRVAGVQAQLGSTYVAAMTPGTSQGIRLVMRGNQISLYVDGVLRVGPVTDANITAAGRAGVRGTIGTFTTGPHLESIAAANGSPVDGIVLDLPWDLRASVNGIVDDLVWDLRAAVSGIVEDLAWDLRAGVNGPGLRALWDVRARVTADSLEVIWDAEELVNGAPLRAVSDLRAAVASAPLRVPSDLRAPVAGPVDDFLWDLRSAVDAGVLDLAWDLAGAIRPHLPSGPDDPPPDDRAGLIRAPAAGVISRDRPGRIARP